MLITSSITGEFGSENASNIKEVIEEEKGNDSGSGDYFRRQLPYLYDIDAETLRSHEKIICLRYHCTFFASFLIFRSPRFS